MECCCWPEHSHCLLMFGGGSGVSWKILSFWPSLQPVLHLLCFQRHDQLLQAPRPVPAQSPFSRPQCLPCSAGQKNPATAFSSQPCLAIIGCCACSLIKIDTWPGVTLCALVPALPETMPSVLQAPSPAPHHQALHPLSRASQAGSSQAAEGKGCQLPRSSLPSPHAGEQRCLSHQREARIKAQVRRRPRSPADLTNEELQPEKW